jgi:hypothetical protein
MLNFLENNSSPVLNALFLDIFVTLLETETFTAIYKYPYTPVG